jgi:SAM-dependent methyltransferase
VRIGAFPENVLERIVLLAGLVPQPVVDTQFAAILARSLTTATKLGVFQAIAHGELTAGEVAARCTCDPKAMGKLLNSLVSSGYLDSKKGRYKLTRVSRKWLLKSSPSSVYDNMLFREVELKWIDHLEKYVKTGKPLTIHKDALSSEDWNLYQNGMRSFASLVAPMVGKSTPVPKGARNMLDIGGSHGYYSVELCRRHPGLGSVILDLPEAVEHAAPILARENMGSRVVHRAGDALTDDLGTDAYDLVFFAGLAHHFTDESNRKLVQRIARALRPGGVLVIHEVIRNATPKDGGHLGQLMDLFFAITSESGTWSYDEMADWQRAAGLVPMNPIRFVELPGVGQQAATKPVR